MALKLRGSSQVKENSITLNKIQDLQSGKILGRAVDTNYDGKPLDPNNPESIVELGAEDIRRISGLWELDSPDFNGLTLTKIGDLGGNLSVEGTGNIDGDFFVNTDKFTITSLSGNLTSKGSMTSADDIKLTKDSEDKHILSSDGSLTSLGKIKSKSSLEIVNANDESKFDVDNSGNVTVSGSGAFTSDISSGSHITLSATDGKITSKLLTVGVNDKKLTFDSDGKLTVDENLEIGGTLTVKGDLTTIESTTVKVDDSLIFLANGNDSDQVDIGFVGQSSNGYHGLVRDKDDQKFKLFNTTENLSGTDSVNFDTATLGTLSVSSVEASNLSGELNGNALTTTSLETGRDFSVSGDVSTASAVSFNGSGNVDLSVTLGDGVVDFAHIHDDVIVLETEGLSDSNYDSDAMIPTAAAVIDYTDTKIASGGFDNISDTNLKLGLNNTFVIVSEVVVTVPVDSTIQENDSVTLTTAIEDSFKSISQVYVNGQKIRYADDTDDQNTLYDYWFSDTSTINFKDGILNSDDNIEIRYYVQPAGSGNGGNGGSNEGQGGNQSNDPTYSLTSWNGLSLTDSHINSGGSPIQDTNFLEGDTAWWAPNVIKVTTTNVADGTTLFWTVSNPAQFETSSGSFTVNSNEGSFELQPISDDTTEGTETFTVYVKTVSTEGVTVGSMDNLKILDVAFGVADDLNVTSYHSVHTSRVHIINVGRNDGDGMYFYDKVNQIFDPNSEDPDEAAQQYLQFSPFNNQMHSGFSFTYKDAGQPTQQADASISAMSIAGAPPYSIGEFELWGHVNQGKSYSFYSENREPDHPNLGWVKIFEGDSRSKNSLEDSPYKSYADFFHFEQEDPNFTPATYGSFMVRFRHRHFDQSWHVNYPVYLSKVILFGTSQIGESQKDPSYRLVTTPNADGSECVITLHTTGMHTGRIAPFNITGLNSNQYTVKYWDLSSDSEFYVAPDYSNFFGTSFYCNRELGSTDTRSDGHGSIKIIVDKSTLTEDTTVTLTMADVNLSTSFVVTV